MKVIDLLNKIANGEDLPTFIKVRDSIFGVSYKFDGKDLDYQLGNEEYYLSDYICKGGLSLNDELEAIEDKPKTLNDIRESYGLPRIEEDKKIEKFTQKEMKSGNITNWNIACKINEIIDVLNKE